jgi:hypothetical protein
VVIGSLTALDNYGAAVADLDILIWDLTVTVAANDEADWDGSVVTNAKTIHLEGIGLERL